MDYPLNCPIVNKSEFEIEFKKHSWNISVIKGRKNLKNSLKNLQCTAKNTTIFKEWL